MSSPLITAVPITINEYECKSNYCMLLYALPTRPNSIVLFSIQTIKSYRKEHSTNSRGQPREFVLCSLPCIKLSELFIITDVNGVNDGIRTRGPRRKVKRL